MKLTLLKTILASAAVGIAQTSAEDAATDECAITVRMQDEGEDLTEWVVPDWTIEFDIRSIVVKVSNTLICWLLTPLGL
jgi:hypothetical protein